MTGSAPLGIPEVGTSYYVANADDPDDFARLDVVAWDPVHRRLAAWRQGGDPILKIFLPDSGEWAVYQVQPDGTWTEIGWEDVDEEDAPGVPR